MPGRDPDIAHLRDLAGRKGFEVMRSTPVKHYALVDATGAKVTNKDESKAFTANEAGRSSKRLPDREK